MTIALLSHTLKQGATSGGTGNSSAINTTGASHIFVLVADYQGASPAVLTDSQSNTWTGLTIKSNSASVQARLYYCENPSTSATHTFAANGTSSFAALSVAAFSGGATSSSFDVQNGALGGGGVTSLATGSVTPGVNNEVLIYGLGLSSFAAAPFTISVGTMLDAAPIIGGTSWGLAMAYEIQTTATARSPSFGWVNGTPASAAVIATFKAAAAGTSVSGALGTAVASGFKGNVNASRILAGALGTATASGFKGNVNANRTIAGALGVASASGFKGNVNANRTIAGALGVAVASGFQGTVVNGNGTTISGNLGTAVASGFKGGINANRTIAGNLGVAVASGFTGGVQNGAAAPTKIGGDDGFERHRIEIYEPRKKPKKRDEELDTALKAAFNKVMGRDTVKTVVAQPVEMYDEEEDELEVLLALL